MEGGVRMTEESIISGIPIYTYEDYINSTTLYDLDCTLKTALLCGFQGFVRLYDHFRKSLYAREFTHIN